MVSNGGIIGKASGLGTTTVPGATENITSTQDWTSPAGTTSIEVLVVGGGGGAGSYGGGAGAGGVSYQPGRPITANTAYEVVIGAGGTGGGNHAEGLAGNMSWGEDSTFGAAPTQIVSEGGGIAWDDSGFPGGSGAGGGEWGGTDAHPNLNVPQHHTFPGPSPYGGAGYEKGFEGTQGDTGGATGFGGDGYQGARWGGGNNGGGGGGAGGNGGQANTAPSPTGYENGKGGVGKDYSPVFGTTVGESGWFGGGGSGGGGGGHPPAPAEGGGGWGPTNPTLGAEGPGEANTGGGGSWGNGGSGAVIIKYGSFSTPTAPGMWTLADVYTAEKADEWPT